MATINSRNESNKYVKQVGSEFIHRPSGATEDVTVEILDVLSDKVFKIFSDENCNLLVGEFKVSFRVNDGIYVNLSNIAGLKVSADVNFKNEVIVNSSSEEKILEWNLLNSSTVINTVLKLV